MVAIALALFFLACAVSMMESFYERDWPRDTFKFVLLTGMLLACCVH